ncbi:MAG: patatin-like phospholipase family protein [Pseudomonadota bacterium]
MARKRRAQSPEKVVNLALQGGGAHGAFAWGVLDALLADPRISFEAATSASAGSMNAVVLAHGLTVGGRDGARQALQDFWEQISGASRLIPDVSNGPFSVPPFMGMDWQPFFRDFIVDTMTRLTSPYQFNPLNINPLRQVLERIVDFERLRAACPLKLFLSATNVRTGKIKVFENDELTVDAVLASACLPFLFQAVEIGDEAYWDGGYMGNPPIYPLIYSAESRDVVIVHINPLTRPDVPRDASSIMDRVNEISFNSSLMREMRAIAFVTELIDAGQIKTRELRKMLIHSIESDTLMRTLTASSKLSPDWGFLQSLRDEGSARATEWMNTHHDDIGQTSTVDIRERYL